MNESQIRTRIIDRAIQGFASSNPSEAGGGLFTTANYAQSLKEEFGAGADGLVLDADTCVVHLSAMEGVERVGPCVWRSVARARCDMAAHP
jgi:hypothetical protein